MSNLYWKTRKLQKYLVGGVCIALFSLALGLLLNDILRGYEIIVSAYIGKTLYAWYREEFQFV